ncbi:AAA family ATPase [Mumia sp. zg.B21]|uniref:ATP-binding protein n=1 Tax=Mumia sp. zg.B21 TaxID=2855447 RepID=UPI001C6DE3BB|nr:AAA family ATPase [Mumia sp. zg.B21]MBW9211565.1 AAA family ATPase [Mumia sp. zg.B21]
MAHVRAPLVGRAPELAVLREAYAEARRGAVRSVLVAGEAGIGKSRLLREFVSELRESGDTLVVSGACADSGSGPLPYAALEGLVRDVVGALGADRTLDEAGPSADALGLVAPRLIDVRVQASPGRLPEVVAGLLASVAQRQPLVVVVEDLHWADDATRATVDRLARLPQGSALLLVASYRSDDVGRGHPLRSMLAELERARLVTRLAVPRLDEGEIAQLAAALLGDDDVGPGLADLIDRSEGVPFYVEELVGFLGTDLPDSLRDLLLLRYSRLSPTAQEFCRQVAAAGPRASYDLLSDALGPDAVVAAEGAAREAVAAAVLEGDEDGYAFRHALVQEAVLSELLPGERRRLHSAYANALESYPTTVARLSEIAEHWWRARVPDRALAAAVRGQEAADRAGSWTTAATLGERALDLWEMVPDAEEAAGVSHHQLVIGVADSVRSTTRLDRALALCQQALAEWPPDDTDGLARALDNAAVIAAQAGSTEGRAFLERGSPSWVRARTTRCARCSSSRRRETGCSTAAPARRSRARPSASRRRRRRGRRPARRWRSTCAASPVCRSGTWAVWTTSNALVTSPSTTGGRCRATTSTPPTATSCEASSRSRSVSPRRGRGARARSGPGGAPMRCSRATPPRR